jgi:hypothetical protein
MAIYPRTQIPKWQAPIRVTRPYIKPNYLADTITSAIQGYGSIQNMNMQQQLFNAKLKAAADAKAQQELNQVAAKQYIMGIGAGAQPALQPAPYVGPMGAGPMMLGTPAVPGATSLESMQSTMQANPTADPLELMRVAGAYKALQPTQAKPMSVGEALRLKLALSSGERAKEAHGWKGDKHTANMATLLENQDTNFLLRFDNFIKNHAAFSDWDTLVGAGGPDLTGAKALEAFGVAVGDEEWEKVRQTAKGLYRHYKNNTDLDDSEIDAKVFEHVAKGIMPQISSRFQNISQKVNPSEIVKAMNLQKERVKSHGLTISN